jgi:hypothetical protein
MNAGIYNRRANLAFLGQTIKKQEEMLFVRGKLDPKLSVMSPVTHSHPGDSVVLISPQA